MRRLAVLTILICQLYCQIRIAAIGDSLTRHDGYADILGQYQKIDGTEIKVTKFAKDGAGIGWISDTFLSQVLNYDYVIFFCGVNSCDSPSHVISMLKLLYEKAHKRGMNVIAITISPWKGYQSWTKLRQVNTYAINGFILSSPKYVYAIVNTYRLLGSVDDPEVLKKEYTTDKLHLTDEGHRMIAEAILPLIK